MNTVTLSTNDSNSIPHALEVLSTSGLVAFPTDTVYGVGSLAFDARAIESIYKVKDRPIEKAISILLGRSDDLEKVTEKVPTMAKKLAASFWPGPLTLVVPKHQNLPDIVSIEPTVGVRVPDHPFARALLTSAGPMAVSSANISGQANPNTAEEVSYQLNERIPLILDGGKTPGGIPSTVVNCQGKEPEILREGPITLKDIQSILS